jgi:hypothetical protein
MNIKKSYLINGNNICINNKLIISLQFKYINLNSNNTL